MQGGPAARESKKQKPNPAAPWQRGLRGAGGGRRKGAHAASRSVGAGSRGGRSRRRERRLGEEKGRRSDGGERVRRLEISSGSGPLPRRIIDPSWSVTCSFSAAFPHTYSLLARVCPVSLSKLFMFHTKNAFAQCMRRAPNGVFLVYECGFW